MMNFLMANPTCSGTICLAKCIMRPCSMSSTDSQTCSIRISLTRFPTESHFLHSRPGTKSRIEPHPFAGTSSAESNSCKARQCKQIQHSRTPKNITISCFWYKGLSRIDPVWSHFRSENAIDLYPRRATRTHLASNAQEHETRIYFTKQMKNFAVKVGRFANLI